jgi:hypothetical protein
MTRRKASSPLQASGRDVVPRRAMEAGRHLQDCVHDCAKRKQGRGEASPEQAIRHICGGDASPRPPTLRTRTPILASKPTPPLTRGSGRASGEAGARRRGHLHAAQASDRTAREMAPDQRRVQSERGWVFLCQAIRSAGVRIPGSAPPSLEPHPHPGPLPEGEGKLRRPNRVGTVDRGVDQVDERVDQGVRAAPRPLPKSTWSTR